MKLHDQLGIKYGEDGMLEKKAPHKPLKPESTKDTVVTTIQTETLETQANLQTERGLLGGLDEIAEEPIEEPVDREPSFRMIRDKELLKSDLKSDLESVRDETESNPWAEKPHSRGSGASRAQTRNEDLEDKQTIEMTATTS